MAEYIDREALFAEFDQLGLGEYSFVKRLAQTEYVQSLRKCQTKRRT